MIFSVQNFSLISSSDFPTAKRLAKRAILVAVTLRDSPAGFVCVQNAFDAYLVVVWAVASMVSLKVS